MSDHAPPRQELVLQAASDPTTVGLRALPPSVVALLVNVDASPRLVAHLRAVYDVACLLTDWLNGRWPSFRFDAAAVQFGAATHDIGKALHPSELTGPGALHEDAGLSLLLEAGIPEPYARFARTHATSRTAEFAADTTTEDLLVAIADQIWKGRRHEDLEQQLVVRLATSAGVELWAIFLELDDEFDTLAEQAPARIAFQASYPISS